MKGIAGKERERQTLCMTYNNCLLASNSFSFFPDILVYRSPIGAWTFDITGVLTYWLNLFKQSSLLHGYMSLQSPKQVQKQWRL